LFDILCSVNPEDDKPKKLTYENPKVAQIQGPMTRSRTKQSEDTLQQMVATILDKAQVEKDEDLEALPTQES